MRYSCRVIMCGFDGIANIVLPDQSLGVGGARLIYRITSGWGPSEEVVIWLNSFSLPSISSKTSRSRVVKLPEEAGLGFTVGTKPRKWVYLAQNMGSSLVVKEAVQQWASLVHLLISLADQSLQHWAELLVVSWQQTFSSWRAGLPQSHSSGSNYMCRDSVSVEVTAISQN